MKLKTQNDIPSDWKVLNVRKKITVKIRSCNGIEEFSVSWQDSKLVPDPEVDLIVIQDDGKEYPCKKDIFFDSYILVPSIYSDGVMAGHSYIKKATTQIIQIPAGISVEIETLEGALNSVSYPDYIAIGSKGELYANTKPFVDDNLEIL